MDQPLRKALHSGFVPNIKAFLWLYISLQPPSHGTLYNVRLFGILSRQAVSKGEWKHFHNSTNPPHLNHLLMTGFSILKQTSLLLVCRLETFYSTDVLSWALPLHLILSNGMRDRHSKEDITCNMYFIYFNTNWNT